MAVACGVAAGVLAESTIELATQSSEKSRLTEYEMMFNGGGLGLWFSRGGK